MCTRKERSRKNILQVLLSSFKTNMADFLQVLDISSLDSFSKRQIPHHGKVWVINRLLWYFSQSYCIWAVLNPDIPIYDAKKRKAFCPANLKFSASKTHDWYKRYCEQTQECGNMLQFCLLLRSQILLCCSSKSVLWQMVPQWYQGAVVARVVEAVACPSNWVMDLQSLSKGGPWW